MDTNPYTPPKAPVADLAPPRLKRRRVLVVILFLVLTLGLYYPVWFFRRRAALNQLDSPRKLRLWPLVIYVVILCFAFVDGVISGSVEPGETPSTNARLALDVIQLAAGILMIVQCFIIKDILEDHLAGPETDGPLGGFVERVKLSGLMTFFFQILYLQWAINRYIAGPQREEG